MNNDNDPLVEFPHTPVMVEEVMGYLRPLSGQIILDCTVGNGGHASKIVNSIGSGGLLLGIDKDRDILQIAKQNLTKTGGRFKLYQSNYTDFDEVLRLAGVDKVNGVLLDLGVSSLQFDRAERGFSFSKDGLLDMRMDQSDGITARELIQQCDEEELADILWKYGEERWSRRIARAIILAEQKGGIMSTSQLASVVESVVPRGKMKVHPATRVFQALRIAVNNELESLKTFLEVIHRYMAVGGRIVVISFHSLEDRIVKDTFREKAHQGIFTLLTKKPLIPNDDEIVKNIRCRSAKLRAAERI